MDNAELKNKTAKGMLWGSLGYGSLQLMSLLFGVILARILTPADYGVVGALTIFTAIATILTESGFTLALVNRPEPDSRELNSVFWFNSAASIAVYTLLFFCAPFIADFYRMPAMTPLARFLFLGFIFGGISAAPSALLLRKLMVRQRTSAMLLAVTVSGVAGLAAAFRGVAYWSIAIQAVSYQAVYAVMLWVFAKWHPGFYFSWATIKALLPFSTKQLATSLFTQINNNFFAMLLARLYGMKPTGFYTQGNKWVTMGSNTITGMIYNVGQPVLRQVAQEPQRLSRVFLKMLRFSVFICFPLMGGLAIVSPELIIIALTEKWTPSVPVMQILCVWGAFLPVSMLYGNLFNALNKPSVYMWTTIGVGVLQLICVAVTAPFGLYTMLTVFVTLNILWLGVWQWQTRKIAGIPFRKVLASILPSFAITVVTLLLTLFLTLLLTNAVGNQSPLLSLVFKIVLAIPLYILLTRIFDSSTLKETLSFLKRKKS